MFQALLNFARTKTWLAVIFCIIPVLIYFLVFKVIALNINYVAFDDILILGIIPGFEDADWPNRWKRLTELFPEHRLVFSRSIILLLYSLFGKINMVWPMIVANISAWHSDVAQLKSTESGEGEKEGKEEGESREGRPI